MRNCQFNVFAESHIVTLFIPVIHSLFGDPRPCFGHLFYLFLLCCLLYFLLVRFYLLSGLLYDPSKMAAFADGFSPDLMSSP